MAVQRMQSKGFVNFPIHDPRYSNTGENGMYVRLVVEDTDASWRLCTGGYQQFIGDGDHVGDDDRRPPRLGELKSLPEKERLRESRRYEREMSEWDKHVFPGNLGRGMKYVSRDYLCVLTIGSTTWSGWDTERNDTWVATYEDLTDAGKELYESIGKLYPGCRVRLQTWLDT